MKKGTVELPFHWIFVMIVGALILVMAITISQKFKDNADKDIDEQMQQDMVAVFANAQVSTRTAVIIDTPKIEMQFSCSSADQGTNGFRIEGQPVVGFPYAFSPDLLKTDRNTMSVYALDWSIPFHVTNFLYVTSPDVRYIFVYSPGDQSAESVMGLLPPRYIKKGNKQILFMNLENTTLSAISSLENQNNYKTKIVFINQPSADVTLHSSFARSDYSAISIDTSAHDIDFYQKSPANTLKLQQTDTKTYVGDAALLAAIFAEDEEVYSCGMDAAYERAATMAGLYQQRMTALKAGTNSPCPGLYETLSSQIAYIRTSAGNKDAGGIYGSMMTIEDYNGNLIANSCPPVY